MVHSLDFFFIEKKIILKWFVFEVDEKLHKKNYLDM